MCAILDACVLSEVFSRRRGGPTTDAGREFFQWLQGGNGKLVIGGKLSRELLKSFKFSQWVREAKRNKGKGKNNGKDKLVIIDSNRIENAINEVRAPRKEQGKGSRRKSCYRDRRIERACSTQVPHRAAASASSDNGQSLDRPPRRNTALWLSQLRGRSSSK